ncbi:hypothetical protein L2E82_02734 [Cichorium intybus]|uniref:Uncharacterized protein n=1 Tax=Cichorium intybus TaxID=13427 RepID=A0ACB9H4M7_CICIN|nr:hypothetical protein L2E82_02734 [Cichorium intybus]
MTAESSCIGSPSLVMGEIIFVALPLVETLVAINIPNLISKPEAPSIKAPDNSFVEGEHASNDYQSAKDEPGLDTQASEGEPTPDIQVC